MSSKEEDDLLRTIILKAIEDEGLPVPAIWKGSLIELCFRVVRKLIGTEACIVNIAAALVASRQVSEPAEGTEGRDETWEGLPVLTPEQMLAKMHASPMDEWDGEGSSGQHASAPSNTFKTSGEQS